MKKKKTAKTKKQKHINLFYKLLVLSIIVILIIFILLLFSFINPYNEFRYIARINNEPVTKKEFIQQILLKRGEVIAYYRTKYGIQNEPGFWENYYNGENPSETAKNLALEELKKIKIQLLLAKQYGLMKQISYKSILKSMHKENKRREDALSKGEIIYGLKQYNEQTYMFNLVSDIAKKLKNILSESWKISDNEIRNYYESLKDKYYAESKEARVSLIKLLYVTKETNIDLEIKNIMKNKVERIKTLLDQGHNFNKIATDFNVKITEQVFNNETAKIDAKYTPELRRISLDLNPGDISSIIEESNAYIIVKCLENTTLSYTPYEKVRNILYIRYIDLKYNEHINILAKKAEIKIYENEYKKIKADK